MNSSNTNIKFEDFRHNCFQVFASSSYVVAVQDFPFLVFVKFQDEEKCRHRLRLLFLTDRSLSFVIILTQLYVTSSLKAVNDEFNFINECIMGAPLGTHYAEGQELLWQPT